MSLPGRQSVCCDRHNRADRLINNIAGYENIGYWCRCHGGSHGGRLCQVRDVGGSQLKEWLGGTDGKLPRLFIVIPNIAIAVKSSMTFIVPVNADEEATAAMAALFDSTGLQMVTEERLLGAATTLASCGIAYAMRYVRASTEGGVELGFKAHDAQRIVMQTMKGAVDLLQANGSHPEVEIDKVTTPGGMTIRGLNEMEHAGFTSSVICGLKAGMSK